MTDTNFEDFIAELDRDSLATAGECAHIRITTLAVEGSCVIVPVVGKRLAAYARRGIQRPRELLMHPNDWKRLKEMLPELPKQTAIGSPNYGITALAGLPVIEDE